MSTCPAAAAAPCLDAVLATHLGRGFWRCRSPTPPTTSSGLIRAAPAARQGDLWPELCEAIRQVHAGDVYFSPRLAGFVLDAFRGDPPASLDPESDQLTPGSGRCCG